MELISTPKLVLRVLHSDMPVWPDMIRLYRYYSITEPISTSSVVTVGAPSKLPAPKETTKLLKCCSITELRSIFGVVVVAKLRSMLLVLWAK